MLILYSLLQRITFKYNPHSLDLFLNCLFPMRTITPSNQFIHMQTFFHIFQKTFKLLPNTFSFQLNLGLFANKAHQIALLVQSIFYSYKNEICNTFCTFWLKFEFESMNFSIWRYTKMDYKCSRMYDGIWFRLKN